MNGHHGSTQKTDQPGCAAWAGRQSGQIIAANILQTIRQPNLGPLHGLQFHFDLNTAAPRATGLVVQPQSPRASVVIRDNLVGEPLLLQVYPPPCVAVAKPKISGVMQTGVP